MDGEIGSRRREQRTFVKALPIWFLPILFVGCLVSLGFRCGSLAYDCLTDIDCVTEQHCVNLRCVDRCTAGKSRSCYSGPPETLGKGPCQGGTQHCISGKWSACTGEVTPKAEFCNGLDNNCNGKVDSCPLGSWCSSKGGSCQAGLLCYRNRCHKPCTPNAQRQSADCGSLVNYWCYQPPTGKSVCKQKCSAKGSHLLCGAGYYCDLQTPNYRSGICTPTYPPREGIKKLGESCSHQDPQHHCDSRQGLACITTGAQAPRCYQACTLSGSKCSNRKFCAFSVESYLSGYCQ